MIGKITYWNNARAFGFITVAHVDDQGAVFQTQYFFHLSNFDGIPVLNAIVTFQLGDPVSTGKKIQAVGVKFATPEDVKQSHYERLFAADAGVAALAGGR